MRVEGTGSKRDFAARDGAGDASRTGAEPGGILHANGRGFHEGDESSWVVDVRGTDGRCDRRSCADAGAAGGGQGDDDGAG